MRDFFCGWYFKCQSGTQTLAVIPAVHRSQGQQTASIQLITEEGAWNVQLPARAFHVEKKASMIVAARNCFSPCGIKLCLHAPGCSAEGSVQFGSLSPIRYDIMGPFRYMPLMECRHSVFSMAHTVDGQFVINGICYRFQNGLGYTEGDRGYSFPKEYAWTQCHFPGGSLMLSAAEIPLGPLRFTGAIAIVQWQGKEYRLATYLGAKASKIENGEIVLRQRSLVLKARLLERHAHPLLAPVGGTMSRTIHESASCRASYCFQQNGRTLFAFESDKASFEYEYTQ